MAGLHNKNDTVANSAFELGLYRDLNAPADPVDFHRRIVTVIHRLGLTDYFFTQACAQRDTMMILNSLPRELILQYDAQGFLQHDLRLEFARNNNHPIYQSVIEDYIAATPFVTESIRHNRDLYQMLKSFGYYDFYLIPIARPRQNGGFPNRSLFAVSIKDKGPAAIQAITEKNKALLDLMADAINHTVSNKFSDQYWPSKDGEDISITPKPLRLLAALAQNDLDLNQAADQLCISIHTANQHIAAARKAFGAQTTVGAVYQAVKARLIEL